MRIASSAPSSVAPSPLSSDHEGQVCANLNVLEFSGNADPIGTVAGAMGITPDQVTQTISDRCPNLSTLEP
jgi:hypothetical protein